MNIASERLTPDEFETAWERSPWGLAAIGGDGNVRAVNPAFMRRTGLAAAALLGIGEADFVARLDPARIDCLRVETADGKLRAIHYCRDLTAHSESDQRLSRVAEALREPLASIYGFAELLLTQNYDEQTRRDLTGTLLDQV